MGAEKEPGKHRRDEEALRYAGGFNRKPECEGEEESEYEPGQAQ